MSRSSGPQVQQGARALPAGNSADHDPRAWNGAAGRQPAQPAPVYPQQSYGQQPAPSDPYQQGGQGYGHPQGHQDLGYGRGPEPQFAPFTQQPQPSQQPQQPAGYQAQYDPYAQPQSTQPAQYPHQYPAVPQAGGYASQQNAHQQVRQAQNAPAQTHGVQLPEHALRGSAFEPQWGGQPPAQDMHGYDLASYAQPGHDPRYAPQPQDGYQQMPPAEWNSHENFAPAEAAADPHFQALQPQGALEQEYAEEEYLDDEYEQPARNRIFKIAAVLAAAIVVGGAGMYTANTIFGGKSGGPGDPPVVKNEKGPAKEKPSSPGGMKFDHADSKIMGRLGEGGAASASTDASGTRKVSTLVVNPDGSIAPPAAAAAAEPSGGVVTPSQSVPGLSIVDVGGPPPSAEPPKSAAPAPAAAAPAAEKPVIISKPQAPPAEPAKPQAEAAPAPAKKVAPPPAEKKVAAAAPAPTAPKPTGAGYVAVLASIPATGTSQLDALKQFADLKAKYGSLLADKTPEVQIANLGEKGTYHRLLVGPPGSQESVKALCTGLKSAGYSGCWPLAY